MTLKSFSARCSVCIAIAEIAAKMFEILQVWASFILHLSVYLHLCSLNLNLHDSVSEYDPSILPQVDISMGMIKTLDF